LNRKIELVAPAGSFEKMRYAFAYGADAVYAGIPRLSLRARENSFDKTAIKKAVSYVRQLGKKIYLTLNIFPHNRKLRSFREALEWMRDLKPDGIILSDPGSIYLARQICPLIPIHLSTQANTVNWASVKFWYDNGVSRIILSRELSMKEIRQIRRKVQHIELESFVHGAICIAYSGRCLLSNYFNHRDPNQGVCSNSCRWQYRIYKQDHTLPGSEDHFFIEETERPGSLMPISEDEYGTYIMNARDLCTIDLIDQLIDLGVDSFKIEGRTKSIYYLSVITRAYRRAIDSILAGNSVQPAILKEVFAVANRGYTSGFLKNDPGSSGHNYENSRSENSTKLFCGAIKEVDNREQKARISVRNRFEAGEELEIISPVGDHTFKVEQIFSLDGEIRSAAHGGGQDVWIKLPKPINEFGLIRKANNNDTQL